MINYLSNSSGVLGFTHSLWVSCPFSLPLRLCYIYRNLLNPVNPRQEPSFEIPVLLGLNFTKKR